MSQYSQTAPQNAAIFSTDHRHSSSYLSTTTPCRLAIRLPKSLIWLCATALEDGRHSRWPPRGLCTTSIGIFCTTRPTLRPITNNDKVHSQVVIDRVYLPI